VFTAVGLIYKFTSPPPPSFAKHSEYAQIFERKTSQQTLGTNRGTARSNYLPSSSSLVFPLT
jgi:hypothetical protein